MLEGLSNVLKIAELRKRAVFTLIMSDYPYVWIADGRKYTLDKPKRKNCRHLVLMETGLAIPNIVSFKISNEWIRSVLNRARDELTREVTHDG